MRKTIAVVLLCVAGCGESTFDSQPRDLEQLAELYTTENVPESQRLTASERRELAAKLRGMPDWDSDETRKYSDAVTIGMSYDTIAGELGKPDKTLVGNPHQHIGWQDGDTFHLWHYAKIGMIGFIFRDGEVIAKHRYDD